MNETPYFMLGVVTGIALCMLLGLAYLKVLLDFGKSCYAYGETSAYRKQNELPPQHTEGVEGGDAADLQSLMASYTGHGEPVTVNDMDDEDEQVRVNIGGGVPRK